MKILTIIARILLGLIFLVFGSNVFLNFIPMPPPHQGWPVINTKVFLASGYAHFIGGLQSHRWLFPPDRSVCAARPDDSRRNHSQHLGISPLNAARGSTARDRRYDS